MKPHDLQLPPRMLSYAEAAEILGVSLRTFRSICASSSIPTVKVSPRRRVIHPDDLRRYIEARRAG